ncbi:MAG TPA: hypothetical protein VM818_20365 [Vicinamibacterales bacterium]|jgi:hypothetical protein|nr:hypothetical protein [Vicinamibacterales bacterium]
MRSVTDELRAQTREADARLTPLDRVRLALELGDRDLQVFASRRSLSIAEARRLLASTRCTGRLPSVANAR